MVHQRTEKTETNSAMVQYQEAAELRMNSFLPNSSNSFVNYFALRWNDDEKLISIFLDSPSEHVFFSYNFNYSKIVICRITVWSPDAEYWIFTKVL